MEDSERYEDMRDRERERTREKEGDGKTDRKRWKGERDTQREKG